MREHWSTEAIVLIGGRAFVAYPYRDAEPVPSGVAVLHVADNPEAFGREHAADMALVGDIGLTLAAAAKRLGELVDRQKVEARMTGRAARKRVAMDALAPTSWPSWRCRCRPTQRCWRRSTRCRSTP